MSSDEQVQPAVRLRAVLDEHHRAAQTSRMLPSGRFVLLADLLDEVRLQATAGELTALRDQFPYLTNALLSSASGQHGAFKTIAALEYVLDAVMFYTGLQLAVVSPTLRVFPYESQFSRFFDAGREDRH